MTYDVMTTAISILVGILAALAVIVIFRRRAKKGNAGEVNMDSLVKWFRRRS